MASLVGKNKSPPIMIGFDQRETFVGDEAKVKRGVL